jgi:3-phenylpropionate/trans-cinnamate dioxygenase ferredoxin subunit
MYNYKQLDPNQCEFIPVVALDALEPGERMFFDIDNLPVVIFNVAGQLFAIADVCSHDDGPVGEGEIDDYEIICPRHGARFDLRDGKALSLPAVVDIPSYPVRVVAGQVEIGIPVDL